MAGRPARYMRRRRCVDSAVCVAHCSALRLPGHSRSRAILTLFASFALASVLITTASAEDSPSQSRTSYVPSGHVNGGMFRLHDSGLPVVHSALVSGFYWIDNNELLLVSVEPTRTADGQRIAKPNYSLRRWNVTTGSQRIVRSFGASRLQLCVFQNYSLIRVHGADGSVQVYHGPVGAERPDRSDEPLNLNTCRPARMLPTLPDWTKGRDIRWLQSTDAGFIDMGDGSRAEFTQLILYSHGARQEKGLPLPFYRRGVKPDFPYYAFKDAFFVESDYPHYPRPRDVPYPVFWLFRSGVVEKIADIPWGPWRSAASFSVVPVRDGLLMVSSNLRNPSNLADAGLYVMESGRVHKLITGWIDGHGVMVSPDGCKAAFPFSRVIVTDRSSLHAIELCGRAK